MIDGSRTRVCRGEQRAGANLRTLMDVKLSLAEGLYEERRHIL